jgi:hypothetical protein
LKGEHRAQLFIKGTHRKSMRQAVRTVLDVRPELKTPNHRGCRSDVGALKAPSGFRLRFRSDREDRPIDQTFLSVPIQDRDKRVQQAYRLGRRAVGRTVSDRSRPPSDPTEVFV